MLKRDPRVLADFRGDWRVHREIAQARGPGARFEGIARWGEADGGLSYVETGTMTLAGQPPMAAERRYFWTEDLSVLFDDGRFFHRVPAAGGTAQHWCDPDSYTLVYDFDAWPDFTVDWRVTGPRKDYRAHTAYRRETR